MAVAGGGKGRRRFRTLSSEARRWLRVLGAAALLVLLMVAAWSRSLGSVGSAVTSASVRLSAGSLNSVAHAAAASAAWLEHQAHLEPGSSGDGGGGGGGSSEGGRDAKAGGRDAKAGGGDSKVDSGGDAKAGGGGAKFATWADELEASRGELPDGPEHEGLPCRASGYCSAGKLGPAYVGEVDSTEGYRKALAASCYKKECIHTTIGTRAHLLGLNLASSAWRLGLANFMIHAADKASCDKVAEAGYTNVTCVWYAHHQWPHEFSESTQQWGLRYMLVARALWMGFHVLMLDTDSWLFRDPYAYLKKEPLASIQYMALQDNGYLNNGGAFYVHNFQPHGPVAFTVASMVDRLLRYNENWKWYEETHGVKDTIGHACMDQPLISDAVASQRLRHPVFLFTMTKSKYNTLKEEDLAYDRPGVLLQYPPEWRDLVGSEERLKGFEMNIHFLGAHGWNETLGGPHFPPPANWSQAFRERLLQEGGAPFWDIEGSPPPEFPGFKNETWVFVPTWLISSYGNRGGQGWWEMETPLQVMLHILALPWGPNNKEYHMKGTNAFNYDVPQALTGHAVPAGTREEPLPRVLALMPGVHLEAQHSTDFRNRTARLVKLAMHLGRVLLMPEPVCNVTDTWAVSDARYLRWDHVHNPVTNETRRKRGTDQWRVHYFGLDDDFHCHWWPHMDQQCMTGAFVVTIDYRELLRRLPQGPAAGQPSPANTVQLGGGGGGGAARHLLQQHRSESGAGGPSLQAAREAALKMKDPHVLFLSAVPNLDAPLPDGLDAAADEKYNKWTETCSFMREVPRGEWNDNGRRP